MRFEMDEWGRHRIVSDTCVGEWAPYTGISTLCEDGGLYIAITQYFDGGIIPTEMVLKVTVVETPV